MSGPVIFEKDKLLEQGKIYFYVYNKEEWNDIRTNISKNKAYMNYLYNLERFDEMINDALLGFASYPLSRAILTAVFRREDDWVIAFFNRRSLLLF